MTVLRKYQTPFIKEAWTGEQFYYAGDCSRIGGAANPRGGQEWSSTVMRARGVGESESRTKPGKVTNSIIMQKSIVNILKKEEWLRKRWDIDVRYQEGGQRRRASRSRDAHYPRGWSRSRSRSGSKSRSRVGRSV